MLKRILVPLDGSAMAERAVLIAGHLARAVEGSVVLLRVVSAPLDEEYERSFLYSASAELSPGIQLALQAATQYLKEATTFSELAGISTELVTTIGQTAEMIVAVAGAKEVDLIVMSSHDHTDVKYRVPGGVAHSVVRNAAVPVFVLHHKWHFHAITNDPLASFDRPFQVLVPLDGSASSEEVLELSARLASTLATPARVANSPVASCQPRCGTGSVF